MTFWIDTHCHLDAAEFGTLDQEIRARAALNNVAHCVLPSVEVGNFEAVRRLAHAQGDSYALGIHPLYVKNALDTDYIQEQIFPNNQTQQEWHQCNDHTR